MFAVVAKTNCRGDGVVLRCRRKGASEVPLEKNDRAGKRISLGPGQMMVERNGQIRRSYRLGQCSRHFESRSLGNGRSLHLDYPVKKRSKKHHRFGRILDRMVK